MATINESEQKTQANSIRQVNKRKLECNETSHEETDQYKIKERNRKRLKSKADTLYLDQKNEKIKLGELQNKADTS